MLQKTKNFFLISCLSIMIYSCSGAQDVIQGKKRSDSNDEFLVEKKNPLTVPPDIDELPVPLDQDEVEDEEEIDIKKVLKIDENKDANSESDNENQTSLEKKNIRKDK